MGFQIDSAGLLELVTQCEQTARRQADHVEQQSRISGWRDAQVLQVFDHFERSVEERLQVSIDQPVQARARDAGFLHHDLVYGGLVPGVQDVGSNHRRHALFRAVVVVVLERLRERSPEIFKDLVRGSEPQLILVLEVVGYQGMMDAGALGDFARRRAFEAVLRERLNGGIKQFMLRYDAAMLLLARRPSGPLIGFV